MGSLDVGAAAFWVAVALVTIVSAARVTRLLTFDLFPPIRWARDRYARWTDGSDWQLLAFCAYCASFWITLVILAWGWAVDWNAVWWFVNGVFAASYLAAILMSNDGDDGEGGN